MYYVYLLRSKLDRQQTYIGCTSDLRTRINQHNAGKSVHTNKFKPWELIAYVAMADKQLAARLEKYLKTGSGRAFAARHFMSQAQSVAPIGGSPQLRSGQA
jgi:putative endonuclease